MTRLSIGLFALVVVVAASLQPTVGARDPNRAGIVVRSGDDDVRKMCVAFDTDEISGIDLLERSGVDLGADRGSIGTAICNIDGKGCGTDDCFCRYPTFWGYWVRAGDDWRFSDVGAADRKVRDGTLDAWSWGRDGKPKPPDLSFDDVCSAAAPVSTNPNAQPRRARDAAAGSVANYAAFAGFAGLIASAAGLAYSPTLSVLFLAIGAGAIVQVVWEIAKLLGQGRKEATAPLNAIGFAVGVLVMYLTGLAVAA